MFAQENSVEPVFLTFDKAPDVEHVVPASGNNLLDIRVQSGFESEEQAEEYKDLLGNKILLESGINRSLGNPALHEKRIGRAGEKDGYQNSQYPIAKYLGSLDKDVWTKKDIEEATDESAKRIVDFIFSEVN
ncbi:HNH endonuclease family protein [Weissella sp. LMG 11983]|uniref:HNH endonuclease family protein n=1 Tax=Weissella sp. LMG 11983 TaxID=2987700 RepID=UPI0021F90BE7|nr:HNH endonuclease family protein [Weissella sp. LMG 11983]MCW0927008.1 HNH endonuclease family protein [Weissella sp. LMG 11983]